MKTRDLITLYKLVLENVTANLNTGICNVMTTLYVDDEISREEFELLTGHFKSVPPPVKYTLGRYYFLPGLVEPRVKFLEEIIEKLTIEADKTNSLIRCYCGYGTTLNGEPSLLWRLRVRFPSGH